MDKALEIQAYEMIHAKRLRPWQGEEEVRLAWVGALEQVTGIHFDAERKKKDSSYNRVIIEFKAPGLFRASKQSAKFKEATERRLLSYILREAGETGMRAEDFIGIAIDGEHICFAQVLGGVINTQHLIPFSPYAVGLVIQAIRSRLRKTISTSHLLTDFGHGSENARSLMQALADALVGELTVTGNSKVKMLFEEWRTMYGQVADMSVPQAGSLAKEITFNWSGVPEFALSARLFVIHTYNSLLIKLLAAEIVSAHGLTNIQHPAQAMSSQTDDVSLLDQLKNDIEKSGLFSQAGIQGFVEEAIFGWYLDIAEHPFYASNFLSALRRILAALSLYRADSLSHDRDVLRDLYQGLVPGKLRQSLGEFYTPDWLVDFTLKQTKENNWLVSRILDPTCGSGAFLLAAIREIRREAESNAWSARQILEHICANVWGFDLNPLAVQTARVNFLMEIADLLRTVPGYRIEIPVLLADAIYSPAVVPDTTEAVVNYKIGSQFAKLDIDLPLVLALDRNRLDLIFAQMAEHVESDLEFAEAGGRIVDSAILSASELSEWQAPLKKTYDQVLHLHRHQWNGIWFRIVRNFFWSATAGHFDIVIGNPPWVRWSKLPETYRERVKPTCERYGIFSKNKRHGGNELDISAMIVYTVGDKWLKKGGRLAFVVTGTLFKNPSSAGFRTFRLEPTVSSSWYLSPVSVDDMKAVKPFEDATNHTVVAVFDKTQNPANYPVPYREWRNRPPFSRAIPADLTLNEARNRLECIPKEAVPVGGEGSPWSVLPPGRHAALKSLAGQCDWTEGRKGITTDLNGVYFVAIDQDNGKLVQIRSRPEAGKKNIGAARTAWVEADLLYPLIKGAGDFEACYLRLANPENRTLLYTFVPNTGISSNDYQTCENRLNSPALSGSKVWFSNYKELLSNRSTYRRQMLGAPFYAVYNVGTYTFQPWKVIWPEMSSKFYAAVAGAAEVPSVGMRPFVPDHKVYFAGFDDKEPAYFLCGLLNSPSVCEWIESHNVSIQVGDVFKHLSLPEFGVHDRRHLALAGLVENTHNIHDATLRKTLVKNVMTLAEDILGDWLKCRTTS